MADRTLVAQKTADAHDIFCRCSACRQVGHTKGCRCAQCVSERSPILLSGEGTRAQPYKIGEDKVQYRMVRVDDPDTHEHLGDVAVCIRCGETQCATPGRCKKEIPMDIHSGRCPCDACLGKYGWPR